MPGPLSTTDAALLGRLAVSRSRQRLAAWMICAGGVAEFVVILNTSQQHACTASTPCNADPASSALLGFMVAVMFLAFIQRSLAAVAAAAVAVEMIWYGQQEALLVTIKPVSLVVAIATAVWCAGWARYSAPRRGRAARLGWAPDPEPVPAFERPIRGQRLGTAIGLILIAVAVAGGVWGTVRQSQVDAQERAATVVDATVVRAADEFTILVALPGSSTPTTFDVSDSSAYPIGSAVRVQTDDKGLRQLVSEPYDATFWHTMAVLVGLIGLGLVWRGVARSAAGRELARRDQPTSIVYVRRRPDHVVVYAGDATPTDHAFAEIPVADDLLGGYAPPVVSTVSTMSAMSTVDGTDVARQAQDRAAARMMDAAPERAILRGTPVPGRWCTVTIGSRTLSPIGPLRTNQDLLPFGPFPASSLAAPVAPAPVAGAAPADPYAASSGLPSVLSAPLSAPPLSAPPLSAPPLSASWPVTTASGGAPLTPVEVAGLLPADAAAPPEEVRRHRLPRVIAYLFAIALPLAAAGALHGLSDLASGWSFDLAVFAILGVANWVGWRIWFRPVVAWNGDGVTVRTATRKALTLPWSSVVAIRPDGKRLQLDTVRGPVVVPLSSENRYLAGRDLDQLVLALRYARQRTQLGIDPPPAVGPGDARDAVGLWLLQLAGTVGLIWYQAGFPPL